MLALLQHQISTFLVNKEVHSLLSENREIKLSALERFPQELLAHRLTTESPPLQKKNQIQYYFDKAQKKTTKTERDRTWIPAIASESRSVKDGRKHDLTPKERFQ